MKLPAIQFYPADWRKDPGIQSLTFEERGIWFEILCLMHESEQRGILLLNGKRMSNEQLSRVLGLDNQILTKALSSLAEVGVSDIDPNTGALMNRRMVRDENLRKIRQNCGKLGGNPVLVNQKPTTHLKQKSTPSSSSSSSSSITTTKEESNDLTKAPASPKKQLTDLWCSKYQATFNCPYMFQGAKDGKAADSLLSLRLQPETVIEIAVRAWMNNGGFWSKQAHSLSGFASKFNEIRGELGGLKTEAKTQSIADSWINYKKPNETKNSN